MAQLTLSQVKELYSLTQFDQISKHLIILPMVDWQGKTGQEGGAMCLLTTSWGPSEYICKERHMIKSISQEHRQYYVFKEEIENYASTEEMSSLEKIDGASKDCPHISDCFLLLWSYSDLFA